MGQCVGSKSFPVKAVGQALPDEVANEDAGAGARNCKGRKSKTTAGETANRTLLLSDGPQRVECSQVDRSVGDCW
jgi:hypothetical protein